MERPESSTEQDGGGGGGWRPNWFLKIVSLCSSSKTPLPTTTATDQQRSSSVSEHNNPNPATTESEEDRALRLAGMVSEQIADFLLLISELEDNNDQRTILSRALKRFKAVLGPVLGEREKVVVVRKILALVEAGENGLGKMMSRTVRADDENNNGLELEGFVDAVVDALTKDIVALEEFVSSDQSEPEMAQITLQGCEMEMESIEQEIKSRRNSTAKEILKKEIVLRCRQLRTRRRH